jgi:hypothetical protein
MAERTGAFFNNISFWLHLISKQAINNPALFISSDIIEFQ